MIALHKMIESLPEEIIADIRQYSKSRRLNRKQVVKVIEHRYNLIEADKAQEPIEDLEESRAWL